MNVRVDGIDVNVEELPAFSYSLVDRIDPSKAKGNSSTTISITPTLAARQALGSEAMAEQAVVEHDLRIGEAGATYWQSTVKVDRWSRNAIECSAVGGNAAWFDKAKNKRLREVEMGRSGEITAALQIASWTDETTYLHYPLIDYGALEDRASGYNVPVQRLRPAARIWRFLEVAFQEMGFAIKAKGRFAQLAPKLIMPNVEDNISADKPTLDAYAAQITGPDQDFTTTTAAGQDTFTLNFDTEVSDPSNSFNTATDAYTSAFLSLEMQILFSARIAVTTPGTTFPTLFLFVRGSGGGPAILSQTQLFPTSFDGTTAIYDLIDFTTNTATLQSGGPTYQLTLEAYGTGGSNGSTISVTRLGARWQPTFIPYQEGIAFEVKEAAPDWTVAEVTKNISTLFNVKFVTNDQNGSVEAWHYDDLLKATSEGIDWRGREDHTDPGVKEAPEYPVRYEFRFKEDDKDRDLNNINADLDGPGLGNLDYTTPAGGYLDPLEVKVDWAATAMGAGLEGDVFIPIMRKENATYQDDSFDQVPRILIADYTAPAQWRLDVNTLSVQPKAFFVWPGEQRWSASFANEFWYGTTAAGTVSQYHAEFLRRATEAYVLKLDVRLWDDELINIDLTRPVMVSDGYGDGWYYVLKVDQKRFGVPEYTRCELIQV